MLVTAIAGLALGAVWLGRPRGGEVRERVVAGVHFAEGRTERPSAKWLVVVRATVESRRRARAAPARAADVALFVELVRIGVVGGVSPRAALESASAHAPPPLVRRLALASLRTALERGTPVNEALAAWVAEVGQPADELAALVRSTDRTGVPIADSLERLIAELGRRRRRALEMRARRLPVTMLVPLVVCVLPAFVVLAVVPLFVVGLDSFSLSP